MSMTTKTAAILLGLGACLALATGAEARGGRGGGGGTGEGDFALRAELTNPGFIEPGSPYGYNRSYSRGPAYSYPFPPRAHRYYRSYGEAPYLYDYQGW